ncbi:SSI family serine proteinase inhibitor [Streptomyces sp. NPDC056470]|uniref:SSI family serine proteinase inhibitor n=1 Tax=Streptomyces sp. NPDC056470 TaxID=3345831 RepID=UPI003699E744
MPSSPPDSPARYGDRARRPRHCGRHLGLSVARTVQGQDEIGHIFLDCPGDKKAAHPHQTEACRDLEAAAGPHRPPSGHPHTCCTDHSDPVTVTARGTSHGQKVAFTHTHTNVCEMSRATGNLFNFQPGHTRGARPTA